MATKKRKSEASGRKLEFPFRTPL